MGLLRWARATLLVVGAMAAYACSDLLVNPAPAGGPHSLSFALATSSLQGIGSSVFDKVEQVRIRIRQGEALVKDTTVAFAPAAAETRIQIPLANTLARQSLNLEVDLLQGTLPLFQGRTAVTLLEGGTTPAQVEISPVLARITLPDAVNPIASIGATIQLSGAALFATGDTIRGFALTWRALDPGIIDLTPAGVATARAEGIARVEASSGTFADTFSISVRAEIIGISLNPSTATVQVGTTRTLTATARDANGNAIGGRTVAWVSSDPSIATVSEGEVRGVSPGSVQIRATSESVIGTAEITVENPPPTLSQISPGSAPIGGNATLVLTGSGFTAQTRIRWRGEPRTTQFISSTELRTLLSAVDLDRPGPVPVLVETPAPGGGSSGTLTFNVVNPVPVVLGLSPTDAPSAASAFTLTVRGSDFVSSTVVRWNGSDRPTEFVSTTELRATISAADVAGAGLAQVAAFTPEPGGGTSNAMTFGVLNPRPVLTAIEPAQINSGLDEFVMIARGTNFAPGTVIQWSGITLPTRVRNPNELEVTVPAIRIEVPGEYQVNAFTPDPGGGASGNLVFRVTRPITQVSASQVTINGRANGADPVAQTVTISNGGDGTVTGLSTTTAYTAGQPVGWLTATLSAVTAPSTLTLQPSLTGLTPGTYTATVTVRSDILHDPPRPITVTLVVATDPRIAVSDSLVAFTGLEGGSVNPAPRVVNVTNPSTGTLTGLTTSIVYAGGQPTGWLTAALADSTAPTSFTLQATSTGLQAGTYSATVQVASAVASNSPRSVGVTLTVVRPANCAQVRSAQPGAADGQYTITPVAGSTFSVYCADLGTPSPVEYLTLVRTGEGENYSSRENDGFDEYTSYQRLRLDPATLRVDIGDSRFATPSAEALSYTLAAGCSGEFSLTGSANIDLRGTPFAVRSRFYVNGSMPVGRVNRTTIGGESEADTTITYDVVDLQVVALRGGGSCGGISATPDFQDAVDGEGGYALQLALLPGPYPVAADPQITLSANSLVFNAIQGANPAPQVVNVSNTSTRPLGSLSATVLDAPNGTPSTWLSAVLAGTSAPTTLTVTATTGQLAIGTYSTRILVASPAAADSPDTVNVTFTVAPDPNAFSFYEASGNYLDSGTADNDGTPSGTVGFNANGLVGQAFQFSGPGAAGAILAPENGPMASATSVTLAAWVNLDGQEFGNGVRRFVTLQPERAVLRLDGQFGAASGAGINSLHFYVSTSGNGVGIYANGVLSNRSCWVHVAGTYDGATARLYLNGAEVASGAATGGLIPGSGQGIKLSNADGFGLETLYGLLDNVRVYARAASAAEIAAWAAETGTGKCGAGPSGP